MAALRKSTIKTIPQKTPKKPSKTKATKPVAKPSKKSGGNVTNELSVGCKVPATTLTTLDGDVKLSQLKGKNVVLYFYPKDDTPGCTRQACGFQDNLPKFKKMNAVVIGISKDSLISHQKFARKHKLTFNLATDLDGDIASTFGAWVKKNIAGRACVGMDRSTFLMDGKGILRAIWRNVKVPGHVEEIMDAVKKLK